MSEENVEIVRHYWDAWTRGDANAALSGLHADIEWRTAEDEPDAQTVRGVQEIRRMIATWDSSFDDFTAEPKEFLDAGRDVIVVVLFSGRLRGSETEVTTEETQVYTVEAEKIVRICEYRTRDEALEAAGLSK